MTASTHALTTAREQVRHAGDVADQVVAVEAQKRHELVKHLHLLEEDHQQKWLEAAKEVSNRRNQREDDVEVNSPQIDAQAAGPAQAVSVRHVGVEDGPDEVDAHA